MQSLGIPTKDIATREISLERQEDEVEGKSPVFRGYLATNRIVITLRDLGSYDKLMTVILKAGVNEIGSVHFGSENEVEKRKEVRIAAIKAAKEKADYLSLALGQKVCAPIKIEETRTGYGTNLNSEIVVMAPKVVSATIAPSNIEISASIDVTFLLCQ